MKLYAIVPSFIQNYLEIIENATTDDIKAAFDRFGDQPLPGIIEKSENSKDAAIIISGAMSMVGPSAVDRFFGYSGTAYMDIISAANDLTADNSITDVTLKINTPGGDIAGMDQTRQAIEKLTAVKNVTVEIHSLIASAGVYLATAKGIKEIVALSPLDEIGSIGIIRAGLDFTESMARDGIKQIKIVSSNAPNKNADPTTEKGLLVHQAELDAVERVFIKKIAEGRNTTVQDVIDNFGKGGIFIASDPSLDKPDAIKSGMIDRLVGLKSSIGGDNAPNTQSVKNDGKNKDVAMNLDKFKSEHPSIYAQAIAIGVAQGVTDGIAQERENVTAHLEMGKAVGNIGIAIGFITEGKEFSPIVNAKYLAASVDKQSIDNRAGESEGDLDTDPKDDGSETEKALADATAQALGVGDYA